MNDELTDENGRRVIAFMSGIRNLSRIAELTNSITEMASSGAWREYRTALGKQRWRDAEFDYFLIASEMERSDAARVLSWNADSAKLAPLMDREADNDRRRSIEDASAAWITPAGETLIERAKRLGWLGATGRLAASPIPKRARTRATTGLTVDDLARSRRAERIPEARRKRIDALVDSVSIELADRDERGYFLDCLKLKRQQVADGVAAKRG